VDRRRRVLVLVATALVVAWPALRQPPTDGFPLSTYPMFATDRGAVSVVATAVGRTDRGDVVRLSPELLAGTDEPMMAIATARREVDGGRPREWCAEVARRVAADPGLTDAAPAGDRVVSVEVVVETHDAVAHFADDAPPIDVDVRATCEVPAA
jgi:hypothetical protein